LQVSFLCKEIIKQRQFLIQKSKWSTWSTRFSCAPLLFYRSYDL